MKMEIIESDLKQLFMWIKTVTDSLSVLEELCKSQQALIESLEKRIDYEHSHYVYGYEKLEKRINNIEHDLALILSVIKDRKNST